MANQPAVPQKQPGPTCQHTRIKSHCKNCAYYHDCPRMKGEDICYSTLSHLPSTEQKSTTNSTTK
jgi:hypothetical protein